MEGFETATLAFDLGSFLGWPLLKDHRGDRLGNKQKDFVEETIS